MPGYSTSANSSASAVSTGSDGAAPTIATAQLEEMRQIAENGKALLLLLADAFTTSSTPEQYRDAVRDVGAT